MSAMAMDETTVQVLQLSYDSADSDSSALRLLFSLLPEWEKEEGEIEFTRFTEGITNTLLKASKIRPGLSPIEIDHEALLIRAYGERTEILIDREREATSHMMLAQRGLAPPLMARFQNGLIYRFIRGHVCSAQDVRRESVWRGTARRLGEWHAVLPVPDSATTPITNGVHATAQTNGDHSVPSTNGTHTAVHVNGTPTNTAHHLTKCGPNLWTTLQKWVSALPDSTTTEKGRKVMLQTELERCMDLLGSVKGIGENGLVMAHCDLLSGNVIIQPRDDDYDGDDDDNSRGERTDSTFDYSNNEPKATSPKATSPSTPALASPATAAFSSTATRPTANRSEVENVCFIDYEYTTPAPAAFDLANHFAEWGGFECEYGALPTRSVRRAFIREYLTSYFDKSRNSSVECSNGQNSRVSRSESTSAAITKHKQPLKIDTVSESNLDATADALFAAVDAFRGVPGLYWGVWAIIQSEISQIDFDYATYADNRLGEWRAFLNVECGTKEVLADDVMLRERQWAKE